MFASVCFSSSSRRLNERPSRGGIVCQPAKGVIGRNVRNALPRPAWRQARWAGAQSDTPRCCRAVCSEFVQRSGAYQIPFSRSGDARSASLVSAWESSLSSYCFFWGFNYFSRRRAWRSASRSSSKSAFLNKSQMHVQACVCLGPLPLRTYFGVGSSLSSTDKHGLP